jgi:hypothetical protein
MLDDSSLPYDDHSFIIEVEEIIARDLCNAGVIAEVLWHSQSKDYLVFRFEYNPDLASFETIYLAIASTHSESLQAGLSAPYMDDDKLLVKIRKP